MGNSDFLFARPSFAEGMARILDLYGIMHEYNKSKTPEEADAWALYKDFKAVGIDLTEAMQKFEQLSNVKTQQK
jgi:hypothetical protein